MVAFIMEAAFFSSEERIRGWGSNRAFEQVA